MRTYCRFYLLGWLFLSGCWCWSQNTTDTLALARHFKEHGRLRKASVLLEKWNQAHPSQADALWLYAQNEYWRKRFKKSRQLYQEALSLQPDNLYLKLDYTETLLGMGRYTHAKRLLQNLSPQEQQDPYAQYLQSKHFFWTGDFKAAEDQAHAARQSGANYASDLLQEIKLARAPWMQLAGAYKTDTQPLESIEPALAVGAGGSRWLDMRLLIAPQQFRRDSLRIDVTQMELSNKLRAPNTGTTMTIRTGLYQVKDEDISWTGGVEMEQRLSSTFQIYAEAAQKPYLHTRLSLDTSITFRFLTFALEWREVHGFWARAGTQTEIFPDNNRVNTYWGWIMTPALKIGGLSARAGYSYSLADARESRFISEKPLSEIQMNPTVQITGVYAPYFTPDDMTTHAVLGLLECRFSKHVKLFINGKYGFSASALSPVLYLDREQGGTLFIQRAFEKTKFTPFEAGAKLRIQFSDRVAFEGGYQFSRIFFYDLQTAGGGLKVIF